MPRHQMLDDPDRPNRPWNPAHRHEVITEMRARIRAIETDRDGNLHVSDVLDALTDDSSPG